ncbi:hypothetical protein TanjilG_12765 [Lupinus angustifolius]|uniref:RING-type domain-containing protein n=2 Tax=Lupinus angustifolius TaxID=3871 RepID=A0A1J7GWH5_LUPAN|nr:hypothetical protein TanjilG_12764 [Lupinus angustifolius]OIV98642.1 hypothetical protein TanjilG_12765 [Lupinus angustifolius]
MQNSPTTIPPPPPLLFPPHFTDQIPIFPISSPPSPFAASPSSIFQITVHPAPPQPPPPSPFAVFHTSVDLSPIQFLLAIIAIITIPALIYTFIFAFWCPSSRRRRQTSGELSVPSELSHHDVENSGEVTDVKYQKEAHVKEIGGECPVCLSVFADGEEIRQLSVCKHSFHASCIDMWLSNHSNCPICRANIAAVTKLSGSNSSAAPTRDGDLQHGGDASALI